MKIFNKYKFSDKSQTLGGSIAVLMGIGAIACFIYGVFLSFKSAGNAGNIVGALGIVALAMAVIGTIIGLLSFKEDDKFYQLSWIGSMLCGVISIFMIAVYMMGMN